jgi:hypothetical protein
MKKVVLPVFAALISIVFLIGASGITVIVRSCNCCGPSIETGLFENVAQIENSCCSDMDSHTSKPGVQSLESKCCTFVTESLKLNNYISTEKITLNVSFDTEPPVYISSTHDAVSSVYLIPLSYHNKHGGRDLVISNCQYLI